MPATFATSGWSSGWHLVPVEVAWRDLDAARHANNAVFLTWFETGRTRYWLDLNGGSRPGDIGFIVARAECDFIQQLSLGDRVFIATRVSEMRRSSFDFLTEIRTERGDLAARGKVIAVLFSWEKNETLPIPDDLRERVHALQQGGG